MRFTVLFFVGDGSDPPGNEKEFQRAISFLKSSILKIWFHQIYNLFTPYFRIQFIAFSGNKSWFGVRTMSSWFNFEIWVFKVVILGFSSIVRGRRGNSVINQVSHFTRFLALDEDNGQRFGVFLFLDLYCLFGEKTCEKDSFFDLYFKRNENTCCVIQCY